MAYLGSLCAAVLRGRSLCRLGRPNDGDGYDSAGYDDSSGDGDERRAGIIRGVLGVHGVGDY